MALCVFNIMLLETENLQEVVLCGNKMMTTYKYKLNELNIKILQFKIELWRALIK